MLRSTMPTLEIMALLKPDQAKETCRQPMIAPASSLDAATRAAHLRMRPRAEKQLGTNKQLGRLSAAAADIADCKSADLAACSELA